jgi:hypothetical protein
MASPLLINGSPLMCSFGAAPSTLTVLQNQMVKASGQLVATINDQVPNGNIPPFGMCMSIANPQVAAATSAASGVLTPQPCLPVITAPWAPPSATVKVGGVFAATIQSKCMCTWAGNISVTGPGSPMVTAG